MFNWFLKYVLLGCEEAIWPKKLEISYASQILTNDRQILHRSYLSNYYCTSIFDPQKCLTVKNMIDDTISRHIKYWLENLIGKIGQKRYGQSARSIKLKITDLEVSSIQELIENAISPMNPSSIYSWFLKPLSVLHSWFPTKKFVSGSLFFQFLRAKKGKFKNIL